MTWIVSLPKLERKTPDQGPTIPRELVLKWMVNPSVEVKGAVYALTSKEEYTKRINPPLTFEMDKEFVLSYFAQCLAEDPPLSSEFADSRFAAASNLVEWFKDLWADEGISRAAISDIKDWIGREYLAGSAEIRRVLVQATLDHLFEDASICRSFADWRSEPELGDAFRRAEVWAEHRAHR